MLRVISFAQSFFGDLLEALLQHTANCNKLIRSGALRTSGIQHGRAEGVYGEQHRKAYICSIEIGIHAASACSCGVGSSGIEVLHWEGANVVSVVASALHRMKRASSIMLDAYSGRRVERWVRMGRYLHTMCSG